MSLFRSSLIIAVLAIALFWYNKTEPTPMSSIRLWSRIRVSNEASDIARLYPLLQEYIQHPERANSVKEFIYKAHAEQATYCGEVGEASFNNSKAAEEARQAEDEAINKALEKLALPKEEQHKWLKQITRLQPTLMTENSAKVKAGTWNTWDHAQDAEGAQYAGLLLMLLCPNIEKLTYSMNYGPGNNILRRNNHGELAMKGLQHLREIRFLPDQELWSDDDRFYNQVNVLDLLRLFHRLPSLERLVTDAVDIDDDLDSFLPPGTSELKTIQFSHAEAGTSDLGSIIRLPRKLEHLTIKEGGRGTHDSGHHTRFPRTIMLALTSQKDSLQSLDIDMDQHVYESRYSYEERYYQQEIAEEFEAAKDARAYAMGEEIEEDEDGSIDIAQSDGSSAYYPAGDEYTDREVEESVGPLHVSQVPELRPWTGALDLRDFLKLTKLGIGIKYLLRSPNDDLATHLVDVLPPSLQSFSLYGYQKGTYERYDAEIEMFLAQKAERFPYLTELHGIDEHIEIGYTIRNVDDEDAGLSPPLELDEDWLEATGSG